jgi:hypothetical protein
MIERQPTVRANVHHDVVLGGVSAGQVQLEGSWNACLTGKQSRGRESGTTGALSD